MLLIQATVGDKVKIYLDAQYRTIIDKPVPGCLVTEAIVLDKSLQRSANDDICLGWISSLAAPIPNTAMGVQYQASYYNTTVFSWTSSLIEIESINSSVIKSPAEKTLSKECPCGIFRATCFYHKE